ncbi:hypothetical protein CAOG_006232 [Capsaspora owczarzaki ATCC 30864]|uniref:LRRNT domain-containing protein n=2 Tax=Capsaspora owczarzaki (strain ATCC 30864) TaxID=595528 RepID=A0A0D2UL52_CAPO3|nr:hypothetical protein CAOG_006232 [Capsaspora owczarzaki ATCC 30864]
MTPKGFAFGLLLLLLCVNYHVQMAQAANACDIGGVCTCSGTQVRCDDRSLTFIPSGIPNDTTILSLNGNQITNISAHTFTGLTALTFLHLGANQITSIPVGAFTGLTVLRALFLSDNQITSIPADAFTGLTALVSLYLYNNQITSIPSAAFKDLSVVGVLALNNNPFTTLPPGLFQGLPNGLWLSCDEYSCVGPLRPNNFAFGANTAAPPSTYGSASTPNQCDTACATCYGYGSSSCCELNCLTCSSSDLCTQCYEGFVLMDGSCVSLASAASASIASIASQASASAASASSVWLTSAASVASAASASAASAASAASNESSGASSGPIIGGVIGGVFALLLLVALVVALRRRRALVSSPTTYATLDEGPSGMSMTSKSQV